MIARALLTTAITAVAVAGVAASAAAAAGTYQVTACNAAPGGANHSWTWSDSDTASPSHYTSYEHCPYTVGGSGGAPDQEHGLSTTDTLGLPNGAPPRSNADWTFTAPSGTTITAITYERYLGHRTDPDNYWSPALRADGVIVAGETCLDTVENGDDCSIGGSPGKGVEPAEVGRLHAQELSVSIVCEAPTGQQCVTGAEEHKVWAAMYGATVTLEDNSAPTLNTPSGPLWEEGTADGYHKGQESLTVEAQDVGGGVQSIILAADGKTVATYEASCDFTYPQPCPLVTGPQTLTLNTSELSDGTHTLNLEAVDAAGNHSTIATKQVTIDNTPPAAPLSLVATPTTPGGSTFDLTWSDPPGQVSPIASATYQVCPAGGGACSTPASAPAAGPVSVTVPGPGGWTLAVWLTDAAGNSSSANAAQITLTVPQPSGSEGSGTEEGTGSGGAGGGASGGKSGSGGAGGGGTGSTGGGGKAGGTGKHVGTKPKARLRVRVRLRGRRLIVHLHGPARAWVRASYVARRGGRRLGHRARRVRLKHGRRVVTFRLPWRAQRHDRIVVRVWLGRGRAVTRMLRRAGRTLGGRRPLTGGISML
jgi:hypothetical protein